MIDLEHLEQYIVIPVGGVRLAAVKDMRELEGDWGQGVSLLWSDERHAVVAFAFEPSLFDKEQAEAWVKKATERSAAASARDEPSDFAIKVLAAQLNKRG